MARANHAKGGRGSFWLVLAALVVVAGGGVAFFLIHNDTASKADEPGPTHTPEKKLPKPTIDFKLKQVTPTTIGNPATFTQQEQQAAHGVEQAIAQFYEQAFITKTNWQSANYDPAWQSFVPASKAAAQKDEQLLTLGKDAPSTYSTIGFDNGDVSVQVLIDQTGAPKSAIASVHFNATASDKTGGTTIVRSVGRYFLQPAGTTWQIYGYQVRRKDQTK